MRGMRLAEGPLGELVTIQAEAGRQLDGIYYHVPVERATGTVIHVHGSFGNFYHNSFLRAMARVYQDAGLAFLSFNLSCHDGLAEGYVGVDDFEYVGGAVTGFRSSLADIDAAISLAKARLERPVVLQGHSLGCDRVLYYLSERTVRLDFVLLSPCDSYALQSRWMAPETVETQIERLQTGAPTAATNAAAGLESRYLRTSVEALEWLPLREYGIRCGDWSYPIPITRGALLEILTGPP